LSPLGLLFLTTNLRDSIDDAILNRVHLTIAFSALTPQVRQQIWRNLLTANTTGNEDQTDASWTPAIYEALGDFDINGRAIKNLLRTASCYAQSEEKPLAVRHLRAVMNVCLTDVKHEGALKKLARSSGDGQSD
jgi:hypothetical protein